MKVLHRGHRYELKHRSENKDERPKGSTIVQYVNTEAGTEQEGVTQQEILRMMLDRNRYCTACQPNSVSERIQYHLQMALVLHEMRALERKVQKGELMPEYIETGSDGHFSVMDERGEWKENLNTPNLEPYRQEWDRPCNHHSGPDPKKEPLVMDALKLSDLPTTTPPRAGSPFTNSSLQQPRNGLIKDD